MPNLKTGNRWNSRRPSALWMASSSSAVRHYVDWRENIFSGHADPRLASRLRVSRAKAGWFDPHEFEAVRHQREEARLPVTDLASENSEDALTWSIFTALERATSAGDWWTLFGFDSRPQVSFWPRDRTNKSPEAQQYREIRRSLEPRHSTTNSSEVDMLLTSPTRLVLVEAKWTAPPLGPRKTRVSENAEKNAAILATLSKAVIAGELLSPGVTVPDILNAGAYQPLRHLLYAQAFAAPNRSVAVAYLLHGATVGLSPNDAKQRTDYVAKQFGGLFQRELPSVVLWEELCAAIPAELLDEPLGTDEFHRGATFRNYLAGRTSNGQPSPLCSSQHTRVESLLLPKVRVDRFEGSWKLAIGPWNIFEPEAKLTAKYTTGGSLIFDHFVFHRVDTDPNQITPVDMAAVNQLMTGNISAKRERWNRVADTVVTEEARKTLAHIPLDARLEDPTWDDPVADAVAALMQPEVGLAIATKLLMTKRPWLIPMLDSRVQFPFGFPSDIRIALKGLRELLSKNAKQIAVLQRFVASTFGSSLSGVDSPSGLREHAT